MSMLRTLMLLGLLSLGLSLSAQIAYVNLDAVLQLMPERQTMEQELRIFEASENQLLKPLSDSLQAGSERLRARQEAGEARPALQAYADSLETMRKRLVAKRDAAESKLAMRQELFEQEIFQKLDRYLHLVAEAEGYAYVFNAQAQGTSVLLRSPDGVNLTRALLVRMKVPLDELDEQE
jgi:Skp family chaperone for outer membrane proteins